MGAISVAELEPDNPVQVIRVVDYEADRGALGGVTISV